MRSTYEEFTIDDPDATADVAELAAGPSLLGTGQALGRDVHDARDVKLGVVREIMLDPDSGAVAYVVLSVGGFLGIGDRWFAVPWEALRFDAARQRFVLAIEQERLHDAPGFDDGRLPDRFDAAWSRDLHAFYGTTDRRAAARSRAGEAAAHDDTNRSGLTPASIPID